MDWNSILNKLKAIPKILLIIILCGVGVYVLMTLFSWGLGKWKESLEAPIRQALERQYQQERETAASKNKELQKQIDSYSKALVASAKREKTLKDEIEKRKEKISNEKPPQSRLDIIDLWTALGYPIK